MYYFFIFLFPLLLYSGIIFYVSSLSSISVPLEGLNFDKVVHLIEYIPFGFLVCRALGYFSHTLSRRTVLMGVGIISFLYGLSDEYHQSFVIGRDSNIMDACADFIGGMIGGYLYLLIRSKFNKLINNKQES